MSLIEAKYGVDVAEHALARIMAFVSPEPNTGCWLWTGATHSDGYGTTSLEGRQTPAHRAVYELTVGPIPDGLDLDHLCRMHPCVNPVHVEPVTRRENLVRGQTLIAAQVAQTHCLRGHPFTEENTRMYRGQRRCRACDLTRSNSYYAEHRTEVLERRRVRRASR